jgi:glycosyltransferase involved in cell wall biosynthesis
MSERPGSPGGDQARIIDVSGVTLKGLPLKVAVVTPYHREPTDWLMQCIASVAAQSYPCTHFLVADGFPRPELMPAAAQHIVLPRAHADNGNTPRAIGSLSAIGQGFDAIAYLDADNWYEPGFVEAMVKLQAVTGAAFCSAGRSIHRADGSLLLVDTTESNARTLVDTSCMFLARRAFAVVPVWALMPKQMSAACDTVFFRAVIARQLPRAHEPRTLVAFRTSYAAHYAAAGQPAPTDAKTIDETERCFRWWRGLKPEERAAWDRILGGPPL